MIGLLVDPFGLPFMARALAQAVLLGVLGGTVGVLVLLRRLAFVTDALTHTVFPGVVVGFIVAGSGGVLWGALVAGLASAALFTLVARHRRVTEDASLAILLTGFFAVGVILVSRRRAYTSDLTAFLFGRILATDAGQVAATTAVLVAVVATLVALRKELLLRAFDPVGAAAMGYRVGRLDLAVNLLVALVVVAGVRAVGTVLVIALLVVPAAAARLVTDRLGALVVLAPAFGALGGWLGLAASFEASVGYGVRLASGATVVLVLVGIYLAALLAGRALPALRGWLR
ncbi:MAG TPA: metal ABC transporter permease [Mycobacteriales bacterium]|nr:metal ABC transporter permease [Mycobacteriales bacterium]